ncbi:MAG: hypothetical protein AB7L09_02070 [Nitrospira sp.]
MSKNTEKKRKTRLKGTGTQKPCVDCGKTKDRFKDFKPRWAGCEKHRTERGRRFYQTGCNDCEKIVSGNIRQPRCIGCDKDRPKKRKAEDAAATTPTTTEAAVQVDPNPTMPPTPADKLPETEPEPVTLPETSEPETSEPETVEEPVVEAKAEASEASQDVTPAPAPAPERPTLTSMADLAKLFGGE